MWKLVLSYLPVEGWVINSDVHGLPDGPSGAMCLPGYDAEIVHTDTMSHGLAVMVDGGGALSRCSLGLFPRSFQIPCCSSPLNLFGLICTCRLTNPLTGT